MDEPQHPPLVRDGNRNAHGDSLNPEFEREELERRNRNAADQAEKVGVPVPKVNDKPVDVRSKPRTPHKR